MQERFSRIDQPNRPPISSLAQVLRLIAQVVAMEMVRMVGAAVVEAMDLDMGIRPALEISLVDLVEDSPLYNPFCAAI